MKIKHIIPNLLTMINLGCGCAIIALLLSNRPGYNISIIFCLFLVALLCDFLDGYAARALNVTSPMGRELDSLADMVTFGLMPGILVYRILLVYFGGFGQPQNPAWAPWMPFIFLLIPIFSALRLAKFNTDSGKSDGFIGLPTPANAIFFFSLYLMFLDVFFPGEMARSSIPAGIIDLSNYKVDIASKLAHAWTVFGFAILFSILLVIPIRTIAMKFSSSSFSGNKFKYALLASSAFLLILFSYLAVPFIILLYFCISILENLSKKKDEVHR